MDGHDGQQGTSTVKSTATSAGAAAASGATGVTAEGALSPVAFGELLRRARRQREMTLSELAVRVGCTKSHLSMIETSRPRDESERKRSRGGMVGLSYQLLVRLEDELGFPQGQLVRAAHWHGAPGEVKDEVTKLLVAQRAARQIAALGGLGSLDAAFKSGELNGLIAALDGSAEPVPLTRELVSRPGPGRLTAERLKEKKAGMTEAGSGGAVPIGMPVEIPVVNAVAAGRPSEFTDLGYPARVADQYVRSADVGDADAFAARVVGDSMEPQYKEGDVVIFSPAKVVRSGMDCFVRLERDQESTFKRVYFEDAAGKVLEGELKLTGTEAEDVRIRLQPLNLKYAPRTVGREEVAGLYAGVSVVRKIG